MKLITWNIYGLFLEGLNLGERVHRVGQALDGTKADVVNLQEVFLSNTLEIIRAEMHNAFQATFYRRFFLFTAAGLVTFSKLRPLSKELVAFHSTSPGFPGWDFPKGALLSEFRDYYLVNCHVPLNRSFNWNRRENYAEQTSAINLLTSVLTQKLSSGKALIMTGDFNLPPNTEPYDKLVKGLDLYSVFESLRRQTYIRATGSGIGGPIDHVFISSSLQSRVGPRQVLFDDPGQNLSDHLALEVDIDV